MSYYDNIWDSVTLTLDVIQRENRRFWPKIVSRVQTKHMTTQLMAVDLNSKLMKHWFLEKYFIFFKFWLMERCKLTMLWIWGMTHIWPHLHFKLWFLLTICHWFWIVLVQWQMFSTTITKLNVVSPSDNIWHERQTETPKRPPSYKMKNILL